MSFYKQVLKASAAIGLGAVFLVSPLAALGQSNASVINAVRAAIETNPEVRASWHQFLAAGHDADSAFGNYLPSLDAQARYGFEHENYGPVNEYDGYDGRLTLTQMLYDGFQTTSSVQRLEEQQRQLQSQQQFLKELRH